MLFGGMEHALLPALRGGGDVRKRSHKQLSKVYMGKHLILGTKPISVVEYSTAGAEIGSKLPMWIFCRDVPVVV